MMSKVHFDIDWTVEQRAANVEKAMWASADRQTPEIRRLRRLATDHGVAGDRQLHCPEKVMQLSSPIFFVVLGSSSFSAPGVRFRAPGA